MRTFEKIFNYLLILGYFFLIMLFLGAITRNITLKGVSLTGMGVTLMCQGTCYWKWRKKWKRHRLLLFVGVTSIVVGVLAIIVGLRDLVQL